MKTCPACRMQYTNEVTTCLMDGHDLSQVKDARIGTVIGERYVIDEVIGEGGMASVYRAHNRYFERPCAIKILHPMLGDDVVRERFRREAKNAQKLAHPNIIEIYEQGETDDGIPYMVLEYLKGEVLAEIIFRGPLFLNQALGWMIQIARGIARAHDLDIIHRDLKPENIFVCEDDSGERKIKILDFGIALSRKDTRLTGTGELFGTPQYMAPERIKGEDSGVAADLYSLGIVYFEMLTGQLPFEAMDVTAYFVKHLHETPRRPRTLNQAIPAELDELIIRLLAKSPDQRPVDAHRVESDLLAVAESLGIAIPKEASAISKPRPQVTPRPEEIDPWMRRASMYEQVVRHAEKAGEKIEEGSSVLLGQMRGLIFKIREARLERLSERERLELIEQKGRDQRQRLGFAVDALGVDLSRAKDEERNAQNDALRLAQETTRAAAQFRACQEEVLSWEGRSGFREPYRDLADAYRAAATQVDAWLAIREEEKAAVARAESAARTIADLDFQVRELRAALSQHEQSVERDKAACETSIADVGKRIETMETELRELATRFVAPFKSNMRLTPVIERLEASLV